MAALSAGAADPDKLPLRLSAGAVGVLAVFRLAIETIPWAWSAADGLAGLLSAAGGFVVGQPLWTGSTFAGLDYLVLMAALLLLAVRERVLPLGRWGPLAGAILLGHLAYLSFLAQVPALAEALAPPQGPSAAAPSYWNSLLRQAVPWNLPALAGLIHLSVAGWLLAWACRGPARRRTRPAARNRLVIGAAVGVCAAMLPLVTVLCWPGGTLTGKKIVLFEKGFLNWEKPTFGRYGRVYTGMYGMMPDFLTSLGARCEIRSELSEAELKDADVVAMFFPDKEWLPGQLERVQDYVLRGGSLLVLGEHTSLNEKTGGPARFNEVLQPTAMEVRFDAAEFEIGGWLHSYQTTGHPMTAGIGDYRNEFGVVIGASVRAGWPSRPILVGQWGYADFGDRTRTDHAMLGNRKYDGKEKLGDLVLVAEQPVGKGRIVAFGDTSGFSNGVNLGAHRFTARVFNYLANRPRTGHDAARQVLGMVLAAGLAGLLLLWGDWRMLAAAGLGAAITFLACTHVNAEAWRLVPDGRLLREQTNPAPLPSGCERSHDLAYIDTTHFEAPSEESWRFNGTGGLALTLMRNGYLTLNLPQCTSEYLDRCGLLVSMAPFREYTPAERAAIKGFVRTGGTFICIAGYEHSAGCRSLLEDFGLRVGFVTRENNLVVDESEEAREPISMGHFKAPYFDSGTYRTYVRFHAAWPVGCVGDAAGAQPLAYGRVYMGGLLKAEIDGQIPRSDTRRPRDVPVILMRSVGRGKVIVIGDTCFAMNRNLELEDGQPFEGMYENADFWRFLLSELKGRPWYPPKQVSIHETAPAAPPARLSPSRVASGDRRDSPWRTSRPTQPVTQPTPPATPPSQPKAATAPAAVSRPARPATQSAPSTGGGP